MRLACRRWRLVTFAMAAVAAGFVAASVAAAPRAAAADERRTKCGRLIDRTVAQMTLREKIGQMVMVLNAPGFGDFTDTEALIRDHHVGSVVSHAYFGMSAPDAALRNNALQRAASETRLGIPVLNAADFEGGVTLLVAEGTDLPNQMGLGAIGKRRPARWAARVTAAEARAMGFQWTFSPVADVVTTPLNGEIGVRSFGGVKKVVSSLTKAQVRAYQNARLIATAKHFPGLGGSEVNSHFELPRVSYDRQTLRSVHLPAFRAAVTTGVEAVMTGHVVVEAVDAELPATLSRRVTTGLLRRQLGYRGVIITDSMTLGAVVERWGIGEAAVLAVKAGADVVMEIGDTTVPLLAIEALVQARRSGEISKRRVNASVRRVLALKCEYGVFDDRYAGVDEADTVVGNPAAAPRAQRISRRAITLVRNNEVLPFSSSSNETTLVAGVTHHPTVIPTPPLSHVGELAAAIDEVSNGPVTTWKASTEDPTDAEIAAAVRAACAADRVVVGTYSSGALPDGQARLVDALLETGRPVATVALGTPYDLARYPAADAFVASYALTFLPTYAFAPGAIRATAQILFGAQPGGRLPVPIPTLYPAGHGIDYPHTDHDPTHAARRAAAR